MDGVTGEASVCLKLGQWHRDLYLIFCWVPKNICPARNLLWFSYWLRRYKEIFSETDDCGSCVLNITAPYYATKM